jgi:hypothetical protein
LWIKFKFIDYNKTLYASFSPAVGWFSIGLRIDGLCRAGSDGCITAEDGNHGAPASTILAITNSEQDVFPNSLTVQ